MARSPSSFSDRTYSTSGPTASAAFAVSVQGVVVQAMKAGRGAVQRPPL